MIVTTVMKNRAMLIFKSKLIALHETIYCFQSSWRFLKFSELLHVYSNLNLYVSVMGKNCM